MDWDHISKELLDALGGRENITNAQACMTRLRVGVINTNKVRFDDIKKVEGVLGVVESDTIQIIFGPGKVNKALEAFQKVYAESERQDISSVGKYTDEREELRSFAKEKKKENRNKYNLPLQRFLKRIANIFVPMLPGIIAAGLINGITNIINILSGGSVNDVWWYQCIRTMGWALFAYLPIFAGYNAAKEFGGSPILGGVIGAICVANPSMPLLLVTDGVQITLPMTGGVYKPGNGGLIAAIIAGAIFAWVEKKIRRYIPDIIESFACPVLVLVLAGISMLVVIQPVSDALTNAIYIIMNFIYNKMGIVGGYILSASFLPMVAMGLHQALVPIHTMLNDPSGPTAGINYLLPILMMSGGGQVGAGLALYMKTKNTKLKGYIRDSIPVGILGVGEPLMYAVTLPLGKPFITACLGAGFGGAAASLLHVGTISQGVSGLFGLLIVVPGSQIRYLVAMTCALAGGFVLTWFFGVDEERINATYT